MISIYNQFLSFAKKRYAIIVLLMFAALIHIGTTIKGGLYADDYVHATYFQGSKALADKGLLAGIGVGDFSSVIQDQFNFFDPKNKNYSAQMNFGMLPWWVGKDAMLHFYRPLTSVTHYIDYQWWPKNTHIMHFVSLCWYVLGLWLIYIFYREVGVEKSVAMFALLLLSLDQSMFQIVTWIASRSMLIVIAIGFFAVFAYHKSMRSVVWYVVALVSLLLAAFSAEAVIGICAYLGAYMLTLDDRVWWKRILHISPFAVLILLWLGFYQHNGYGAAGLDFYLDPTHEPLEFLLTSLIRLPSHFFELIMGIDFMTGQVRPDIRLGFSVLGVLFFISLLWLLWVPLKTNKLLRFFFLASFLALIPGLTISLASRVMVIPFVGMAVFLAYICQDFLLYYNLGIRKFFGQAIAAYVFFMHIFIAGCLACYATGSLLLSNEFGDDTHEQTRGYIDLGINDFADKPVVLINAFKPFWLAFYAQQLDASSQKLPSSLRVLASAFYPITITRMSKWELILTAKPGLQLDSDSLTDLSGRAPIHFAYLTQQLMGLSRSSRDEWYVGQRFNLPEMQIKVNSLYHGKPQSLTITLNEKDLQNYRWAYWDKKSKKYQEMTLPEIGQSRHFDGFF